jgi:hypothetical protein
MRVVDQRGGKGNAVHFYLVDIQVLVPMRFRLLKQKYAGIKKPYASYRQDLSITRSKACTLTIKKGLGGGYNL